MSNKPNFRRPQRIRRLVTTLPLDEFVTLDLEGFRSGSMNALLPADQLRRTG